MVSAATFLLFFSLSLVGGGVNIPVTSLTPLVPAMVLSSSDPERSTNSSAVSTLPIERFRLCREVEGARFADSDVIREGCLVLVDRLVGV